jgi:hypothetical protein
MNAENPPIIQQSLQMTCFGVTSHMNIAGSATEKTHHGVKLVLMQIKYFIR